MDTPDLMDDRKIRRSTKVKAPRQCTAQSKRSGKRCRRAPIRGGVVCSIHGGAAPQVKKTARERLAALAEPAIEALRKALDADDLGATLKAAQLVLDRTGFHPTQKCTGDGVTMPGSFTLKLSDEPIHQINRIIVDWEGGDDYLRWMPIDRITKMRDWKEEARTAQVEERPPLHEKVPEPRKGGMRRT